MSKKGGKKKSSASLDGWEKNDSLFYKLMNNDSRLKVASFDFDGTLALVKSGAKFCTAANDWKFWDPVVPQTLKKYYSDGFRIVVFSNQNGIEKGHVAEATIEGEFEQLQSAVGVPFDFFVATASDGFRKPSSNMWDFFVDLCYKDKPKPSLTDSFFCGDAGGRPKGSGQITGKKDFSCSDRKFALNVGLRFFTPEEFFLQKPTCTTFDMDAFDPHSLHETDPVFPERPSLDPETLAVKTPQEMVVMVAAPGSGKSTFTRRYFINKSDNYVQINRDTLKDMKKCVAAAGTALRSGKSVVIDNTNPKKEDRKQFIDVAKQQGVRVRILNFRSSFELNSHLNSYRERYLGHDAPHVPDIALRMFFKNYQAPTVAEGAEEVLEVAFVPKFDNDNQRRLFYQWS